jgi:hypothetical protein
MNYLIAFILLITAFNTQAQTCTRIHYELTATVNGQEDRNYTEITTCGNKSVTTTKNGVISSKYIVNPAEKRKLLLLDRGGLSKTYTVLPTSDGDTIRKSNKKIKDEDFHFTGEFKTIAGYACEGFTLTLPGGETATGYLARGLKVEMVWSEMTPLFQSKWGMVMECSMINNAGMPVTLTVTQIETGLDIGDAYFSTVVPEGYSDLMEEMGMPHE